MAIMDYIPVILFLLATGIIARDLKGRISSLSWWIFVIGITLVTCAGFLKATYKLLYSIGVGDFLWMSDQLFANQASGLLLAGIGLTLGVTKPQNKLFTFIPTMALVGFMIIGICGMDASLCYLAAKMKQKKAMIFIIISFFLAIMMGYLSSRDFTTAYMNWVAQSINLISQLLLYLGCRKLDRAGLGKN